MANLNQRQDWRNVEAVREQIQRAGTYLADGARADYLMLADEFLRPDASWCPQLDSPLEAIFWAWWLALGRDDRYLASIIEFQPQFEVTAAGQDYRLDFCVLPTEDFRDRLAKYGIAWPRIGAEVDGHAFHEKTQEQVAYRNKRDRDLQQAGWRIFHYSWSEVVTNPVLCVSEVAQCGRMAYQSAELALWRHEKPAEATTTAMVSEAEDLALSEAFDGNK